jgi:hypothetical protein
VELSLSEPKLAAQLTHPTGHWPSKVPTLPGSEQVAAQAEGTARILVSVLGSVEGGCGQARGARGQGIRGGRAGTSADPCLEPAQLKRWLRRAVSVRNPEELFEP